MDLLAHPFRLVGGAIATVEEGSDDDTAQAIAIAYLTRKGERTLVPTFGISDPLGTSTGVALAELAVCLDDYGPAGVTVDLVEVTHPTDTLERVTLAFTRQE